MKESNATKFAQGRKMLQLEHSYRKVCSEQICIQHFEMYMGILVKC